MTRVPVTQLSLFYMIVYPLKLMEILFCYLIVYFIFFPKYLIRNLKYTVECVHFVSEWRCFLLYGQLIGIHFYYGDKNIECDREVINAAIKAFPNMPAGCALDFGVTDDGRTLLIEMNDGYSLGIYDLEPTLYVRLLTARWAELNGTVDALREL